MDIKIINPTIPSFNGKILVVDILPTEKIKPNTVYKLVDGAFATYWIYKDDKWTTFGNDPEVVELMITENGYYDATVELDGKSIDGYSKIKVDIEEAKPVQEKAISITKNGTTSVLADNGKTLSRVDISTSILTQKPEEEKVVNITENGTTVITPTDGYVISKVTASAKVNDPNCVLQEKLTFTNSTIVPDEGYYGLEAVHVAVPNKLQHKTTTDSDTLVPDTDFYGLSKVTVNFDADPYISEFINGTSEDCFVIPNEVTAIKPYAFYGKNYSGVVIPNSVTSIGENAFTGCDNLSTVYYGGPSEQWDENGFADHFSDNIILNCSDGTDAPDGLGYIINDDRTEYRVGQKHKNVGAHVEIAEELYGLPVTEVGVKAFCDNNTIQTVIIPNSVNKVSMYAFANCSNLSSITIGENVKTFDSKVFWWCDKLTEINYNATNADDLSSTKDLFRAAGQSASGITLNIGNNVLKIPSYLLYPNTSTSSYYPKITNIVFAEDSKCTSIGSYAFMCGNALNIAIPDSITDIGYSAFGSGVFDFSALTHIPAIQSNSFSSSCQIIVPDNLYDSWITTYNWSQYKNNIIKASDLV